MSIFDETKVSICIGCGCDDNHACLDAQTNQPCHWERIDRDAGLGVCSCCSALVKGWDAGDRTIRVPIGENLQSSSFQDRVKPWLLVCFGEMIANDADERCHRFLEESLELIQACGCSVSEAHQLVDYVFGRPVGEKEQEVGGVMVTLAALCLAQQINMHEAGELELNRIWKHIDLIRDKQAAKPEHSALPA